MLIKTFGCKVNFSDSVALSEALAQAGWRAHFAGGAEECTGGEERAAAEVGAWRGAAPEAVLINACCVTAEAERKAAQFVRHVRRVYPLAAVMLTGCAARLDSSRERFSSAGAVLLPSPADVAAYFAVHVGAADMRPESATLHVGRLSPAPTIAIPAPHTRSRAFIKVQDGCRNCCAYCVVPYVRPFLSRPPGDVLSEVECRLAQGVREVVLTGVNIGQYGIAPFIDAGTASTQPAPVAVSQDGRWSLCDLIDAVLERLPPGARLRLSSIEPQDVTPRLLAQLAHPRVCPHVHLPLQSGSDNVLRAMGRPYSAAEYLAQVRAFRTACPDGALTTDILVGFPTETETDLQQTLALCSEAGFERAHVFGFSPRPLTRAAALTPLTRSAVHQRVRLAILHCRSIADHRWRRFIGQTTEVVLEEEEHLPDGGRVWRGHGGAYQLVRVMVSAAGGPGHALRAGEIVAVRLIDYSAGEFTGELE